MKIKIIKKSSTVAIRPKNNLKNESYAEITRKSNSRILSNLYKLYKIFQPLPDDIQNYIMTFTPNHQPSQLLEYIKFNIRNVLYKHLLIQKYPISFIQTKSNPNQNENPKKMNNNYYSNEIIQLDETYNDCDVQKKKKKRYRHVSKKKIKFLSKKHETICKNRSYITKYVTNNDFHYDDIDCYFDPHADDEYDDDDYDYNDYYYDYYEYDNYYYRRGRYRRRYYYENDDFDFDIDYDFYYNVEDWI
jgi:hypothetical protein